MGRYYKRNGTRLPSVTTITGQQDKPALVYWAANCAVDYILEELEGRDTWTLDEISAVAESARKNFRKVSAKALDIGSAVHAAIEGYLKSGRQPEAPSDEVASAFLAFLEWEEKYLLKVIATEQTVYADRYAGTLDLLAHIDPTGNADPGNARTYVVDFKASKGIYPEYQQQVSAYRHAADAEGSGILRLDKETGDPEWKDITASHEIDFDVFCILVDLWWAKHPNHK